MNSRRLQVSRMLSFAIACAIFLTFCMLISIPYVAAKPSCTAAVAKTAAPQNVTIGPINDLNPDLPAVPIGALLVPAFGSTPSYCLVTGSVVTNPNTGKTANFGIALPLTWNNKFLFSGCGGYCGVVFQSLPNDARGGGFPPDALAKGYAIAAKDDGHVSTPLGLVFDATWALTAPGVANVEAVTDFYYRAVHQSFPYDPVLPGLGQAERRL